MQEGAQHERLPAGEVVRERLGERGGDPRGERAEDRLGVGRDRGDVLDDLERVTQDVAVVVGALLQAAALLQLGDERSEDADLVHPGEGPVGGRERGDAAQLVRQPFPGGAPHGVRVLPRARDRVGRDREPELLGEAGRAEQAHRVVAQRPRAHQAQAAGGQVVEAPVKVDDLIRRVDGHRQRVDRQVPAIEVLGDPGPLERGDVHGHAQVAPLHPPRAEAARQQEAAGAVGPRQLRRGRSGVAVDGQVEIAHGAAEERVAHPAAHGPGAPVEGSERGEQPAHGPVGAHPS